MNVTVLTTPTCNRCDLTMSKLTREGITFTAANAAEHPNLVRQARELGHREAPVVLIHDDAGNLTHHWSGFRPRLVEELHDEQTLGMTWPPRGVVVEIKTGLERLPPAPTLPATGVTAIAVR